MTTVAREEPGKGLEFKVGLLYRLYLTVACEPNIKNFLLLYFNEFK